jgi:TldD protein
MSEADFIFDNPKFAEKMKIGTTYGSPDLNIVDDATVQGARGFYFYDDEGVPGEKSYLIKKGVLANHIHSRESAYRMGEPNTGNARAISYRYPPIVRMSSTYIEGGKDSFEGMISGIENGIYACGMLGGNTDLEMFTFSAEKAYHIKNGKVRELLRDVVLTGNVFETLKNIDAIGNDFRLHGGMGGCGKGGQSPLPVSDGGPHIRIQNLLIG